MGVILEILGILGIVAGGVILSIDWKQPIAHKFLVAGILIFIIGQNHRKIKKLEKILKQEEKE